MYRTRKTENDKFGDWRMKEAFDPLAIGGEKVALQSEVLVEGKSIFVVFENELSSNGAVHELIENILKEKVNATKLNAHSKKEITVSFSSIGEAKEAENILLHHIGGNKVRINRI